jgi:tetratricopeptide (TPR) repeat protein
MQNAPAFAAILKEAVQHHRAGRLDAAERLYRDVLAVQPHQADVHHNLGAVLARAGRLREALPHLKAAIEGRPGQAKYWSACLDVLQALGARDELAAMYRRLVALQPTLVPAHYNLANTLKDLGQLDAAARSYGASLKLAPGFAPAHNNLGNVHKLQGRLDEAAASYRAAIAADPKACDAHFNLGNILEQLGELAGAEACYRNVLLQKPDHPQVDRHLGAVLLEQGRTAEGLEAFMRHALRNYGPGATPTPAPMSAPKDKHDREQRAWLGDAAFPTDTLWLEGAGGVLAALSVTGGAAELPAESWRNVHDRLAAASRAITQRLAPNQGR